MTSSLRRACLALAFLGALAACDRTGSPPPAKSTGAKNPHLAAQVEMEKATMDFSRVVAVRLQSDGKRVEVVSVMPAVIAEGKGAGQGAKTIFRVNDTVDGLVLFTRDVLHDKSYRTEIKFSELESKKKFTFPVVQPNGSLKEIDYVLEKIVKPAG